MAERIPEERLTQIETALLALEQALHALESRLDGLERDVGAGQIDQIDGEPWTWLPLVGGDARTAARGTPVPVKTTALIGGALLALAGAYLLRALTDFGTVAPVAGLAGGAGYAAVWFALAGRRRTDPAASSFHGAVACTIALPLVWEAATRFHLLGAVSAALALGAVAAVAFAVSAHAGRQPIAWMAALAVPAFAVALVSATDRLVPFACLLIALGVATLWLGYVRDWFFLRWPVALVADLLAIAGTVRVLSGNTQESAAAVAALALLLPAAYLVNIIVRTVIRGRDVIPFEVVQTIAALGIGLGCVIALARHATFGIEAVAWGALALGAACYGVAFVFIARRQHSPANLYFYTSVGLLLVLVGTALRTANPTLALSALAIAMALIAGQYPTVLLTLHAAIYAGAALIASAVLPFAASRLAGSAAGWPPMTGSMAVAVIAAGLSFAAAARHSGTSGVRVERVAILVLFVLGASGWIVDVLVASTASGPGPFDRAGVATIRTVVIAGAAMLAALIGRFQAVREVGWLVYPLLAAGGLKLIVDDLPHSRPATLFVALTLYGVALIAAPRLRGNAASRASGEAGVKPPVVQRSSV